MQMATRETCIHSRFRQPAWEPLLQRESVIRNIDPGKAWARRTSARRLLECDVIGPTLDACRLVHVRTRHMLQQDTPEEQQPLMQTPTHVEAHYQPRRPRHCPCSGMISGKLMLRAVTLPSMLSAPSAPSPGGTLRKMMR